ncbi:MULTISPECIES: 50S ribosomal protein L21 [unclassified Olsenella]|uniref:50S ribosomal protein L21 n=1 Tax=unclassified Olsenella TaxID=2638792 RepID=UPI000231EE5F|nr:MULTISPECIES: 50S ribosomal protein L21 [unclassified Olsenella]EHF01746.1 50S ribosomal protein L21 [Olsenella sp. oral taxon 809 str. F0356]KXB62648.1 ribosomal protein L21 [Olsenella sp. DNF00959]
MYAIVTTGGKQYKVAKGDIIDVEKLDAQPGDKVELDVLMINDGTKTIVDAATLEGQKVTAEVVDQFKDKKVIVFKLHKRKRYHRTKGHRQNLTKLQVVAIPGEAGEAAKSASTEE